MVSGSAPLAPHVLEFLRIVFCCQVVEGYGQTECSGASTVQHVRTRLPTRPLPRATPRHRHCPEPPTSTGTHDNLHHDDGCSPAHCVCDHHVQVGDMATIGHVGVPLACNEVMLVSVPDLGYNVDDLVHGKEVDKTGKVTNPGIPCEGRGEICYRGFNVFPGYYKDAGEWWS